MSQLVIPAPLTLTEPQGVSCLPLVELDKAAVRTKHKSVLLPKAQRAIADCSYGAFGSDLEFTAWEMFHAAKKTELTRTFTQRRAEELGLVFAHEHHDRFVWGTTNFRCADGSGLWLEDFSGTGLAGRIGEAVAYLTMVKLWGYVYWDRVATVWLRAAHASSIRHDDMLRVARYTGNLSGGAFDLQPDFVFEKQDGTTSLMEAKGSFVSPGNDRPDVKSPLKHGLEQLDAWASLIAPAPTSSIAIGTLLREASDLCTDPSMILHVDPPPPRRPDILPVELPRDQIRRGNYGAWLAGMGLRASGTVLIARREARTTRIALPVATINGRRFALSMQGWRADQRRLRHWPWWHFELMHMPPQHQIEILRHFGSDGVFAVGLETSILRVVERAVGNPDAGTLMELESPTKVAESGGQRERGFYGSVMPDGSLMGVIAGQSLEGIEIEEFTL